MTDLTVKAVLQGDGSGLTRASQQAVTDLNAIRDAVERVNNTARDTVENFGATGARSLKQFIDGSAGLTRNIKSAADSYSVFEQTLGGQAALRAASQHAELGKSIKFSNLQVQELTYGVRHLVEEVANGVPVTQILFTQASHLSAAFTDGAQVAGLFRTALSSVWTWAGLAAAAVLAGAAAVISYENSVRGLANAINAQGNPFNLSLQQADALSQGISQAADTSVAEGRKMAAAFTQNNIDPRLWTAAAVAVRGYSTSLGVDLDKALEAVSQSIGRPAEGVDKLNSSINVANGAQTENIKLLAQSPVLYNAQAQLLDVLGQRMDKLAGSSSGAGKAIRDILNTVKNAGTESIGGTLDKLVPGQFALAPGQLGLTNQQSEDLARLADATDDYRAKTENLKAQIADANTIIHTAGVSEADLANAHRVLTGASLQLTEAEHQHEQMLLRLNPLELARQERIKSLIAGSAEAIAQAQGLAAATALQVANANSGTIANQKLNDQLDIQKATLPYVTAATSASGKALKDLNGIVADLTDAMSQQQQGKHYLDTIKDIRNALGGLSGDTASWQALDDSYAVNLQALKDWRDISLANLDTSKAGYDDFARYVGEIYSSRLTQLYADDLAKRRDWASGVKLGLYDLEQDQSNWAATSRELTEGAGQEFQRDWVDAVVNSKNPLSAFFSWYLQQLASVIYQQRLAGSVNAVAGGLTNLIGRALGLGGGIDAVSVREANIVPNVGTIVVPQLHGGGRVDNASVWRSISPEVFRNAPRFHSGSGGLSVGERAAILKDDEYVYTAEQNQALTARPSGIAWAIPSAPPIVNINAAPGVQVKQQGPAQRNANGQWSIDFLAEQVSSTMAARSQRGVDPLTQSLENTHSIKRRSS
ncbi:MAG TPA: phage tail length tape measure family protein [Bryobacteraceae bacterium]|nr:phage tail length tape measure family protein [Bryobacteraceae bacterium]